MRSTKIKVETSLNLCFLLVEVLYCTYIYHLASILHKHVVHKNVVGGSNIIWDFPLVIADSERHMPGIKHEPLGWYTSALITGL